MENKTTTMELSKAVFSDKTNDDVEVVEFLRGCLIETGGIPSISKNLSRLGYQKFCDDAYSILDDAKISKNLNLNRYSSTEMKTICNVIISELDDCGDLEILMGLDVEKATKLIQRI